MSRRGKLVIPSILLDRDSAVPLHRQICQQIAQAIRSGVLHSDARLPSSRVMAALLKVSRNTVLTAYDELSATGSIRGEQGAGMCVNSPTPAGPSWLNLRGTIRAANYPAKVLSIEDPDGNPLYIVT